MDRPRLSNKLLKSRYFVRIQDSLQQIEKYCLSLVKKNRKKYYNNLCHKKIINIESFWKYAKSLFTDKRLGPNEITSVQNDSKKIRLTKLMKQVMIYLLRLFQI